MTTFHHVINNQVTGQTERVAPMTFKLSAEDIKTSYPQLGLAGLTSREESQVGTEGTTVTFTFSRATGTKGARKGARKGR